MWSTLKGVNIAAIPGRHWSIMYTDWSRYLIVQIHGPRKCPVIETALKGQCFIHRICDARSENETWTKCKVQISFTVLQKTSLKVRSLKAPVLSKRPMVRVCSTQHSIHMNKLLGSDFQCEAPVELCKRETEREWQKVSYTSLLWRNDYFRKCLWSNDMRMWNIVMCFCLYEIIYVLFHLQFGSRNPRVPLTPWGSPLCSWKHKAESEFL